MPLLRNNAGLPVVNERGRNAAREKAYRYQRKGLSLPEKRLIAAREKACCSKRNKLLVSEKEKRLTASINDSGQSLLRYMDSKSISADLGFVYGADGHAGTTVNIITMNYLTRTESKAIASSCS